jgi:hypothetical protein
MSECSGGLQRPEGNLGELMEESEDFDTEELSLKKRGGRQDKVDEETEDEQGS